MGLKPKVNRFKAALLTALIAVIGIGPLAATTPAAAHYTTNSGCYAYKTTLWTGQKAVKGYCKSGPEGYAVDATCKSYVSDYRTYKYTSGGRSPNTITAACPLGSYVETGQLLVSGHPHATAW